MSGDAPATSRPDLTISIATYDRPLLLERCIRSCLAQENKLGLSYEILITDNHPSGNGLEAVEKIAPETDIPIRYQRELARNMSVLRNAGIHGARGELLAIIDDDEFADPDWLDELVGTLRRTGADIAVGPRFAIFAAGKPPAYDPKGQYFARDFHLPPDSVIKLVRSDGKPLIGLGTGNSVFRVDNCFRASQAAEPFSLAFGDAGGEDPELFIRLFREGRTLVWAAGARVTEIVPEHRTEIAYRLIRTKRETQIYVTIYLHYTHMPRLVWLQLMAKGLIQLTAGALIAFGTLEHLSKNRIRGRLLMAHGIGKLSWHQPVGFIDEPSFKSVSAETAGKS